MEQQLRCNNQLGGPCRRALTDTAVVTTCSHIFCVTCAEKTGFASSPLERRECPVCRNRLANVDDAVQTRLQPSEDYKTSVLSGLDPTTIMECAGRALGFWTYQTTQEIFYQQHMTKTLTEKYNNLSIAMDKIITEANGEIQNLQNKLSSLSIDQKTLQQRYDELNAIYKDKSKKHAQTQQLYDTLKKKVMMKQLETNASDDVNHALQSSHTQQRPATYQTQSCRQDHSLRKPLSDVGRFEEIAPTQRHDQGPNRAGLGQPQSMLPPPRPAHSRSIPDAVTPQHRTVLPGTARPTANRSRIPMSIERVDTRHSYNVPHTSQGSPLRHQLSTNGPITRVATSTSRGYGGISSGMKVGMGRADTAGDITGSHRYSQHQANFTDPRLSHFHRPANSFDNSSRPL